MDDRIREDLVGFVLENFLFGEVGRMPGDSVSLMESGVLDSTGVLELIEFLEGHFAIEVTESETIPENLGSVANLSRYVGSKRAESTTP